MSKFVIKANNGKYFNHLDCLFVHHTKGTKYKTIAEAQQVFDEMLAKQPSLSELAPEIIPIEKQARLTHAEFLWLRNTLTKAQFDVYLYLLTLNPFSDRELEIDTAVISEQLGFVRRTVQVALGALSKGGLINWEVTKSKVRVFSPKNKNPDYENNKDKANPDSKNDVVQDRQGVVQDRQSVVQDRQGVVQDRQSVVQDRQRDSEPALANGSETSQPIKTISTSLKLSQTAHAKFDEERFENFDQENSENEKNVESLEQTLKIVQENFKNTSEPTEIPNETTPESENSGVDQNSAAPPPEKFFKTLRDFVIYEAKQDPKINSPEIWANTCLARNREEWQAKWDTWERSRTQTVVGLPEKVEIDFEASKKALEEARKLLPAWMRANRG